MKIWIDTASGTWGELESSSGSLVVLDTDALGYEPGQAEAFLQEDGTDGEIAQFGRVIGRVPVVMDDALFKKLVAVVDETIKIGERGTRGDYTGHGVAYKITQTLGLV